MSSTPIYDELAATYLADLIPAPGEPAGPGQPGEQAPAPAAQASTTHAPGARTSTTPAAGTPETVRPQSRSRPKV
ncbi:hypothetical protein ACQPYE_12640 [Actinosynnema sp. CA-299493]